MTTPNVLVEMSNDAHSHRDANGLSPEQITQFIERHGRPTRLEGRFGERSKRADGFDVAGIDKFLSRDASWFPASEPTLVSTEEGSDD